MVASAQLDYYALDPSYTILLLIKPFANIKYANTFTPAVPCPDSMPLITSED